MSKKISVNGITYFSLFLVSLFAFLIIVGSTNWNTGSFTIYDSTTFYNIAKQFSFEQVIDTWSLAYKLYPCYLVFLRHVFNLFGISISYGLLIGSNILLLGCLFLIYKYNMNKAKIPIWVALIIFFEPSVFAFSLTLEREVFTAIFFVLTSIACSKIIDRQGSIYYFWMLIFFIILANLRIELVATVILALAMHYMFLFFKSAHFFRTKVILISCGVILLFAFIYFISNSEGVLHSFNYQLADNASGSGLGAKILNLPLPLRVSFYGFFGFFMPIPFYHILTVGAVKPYQVFLSFSGISYLFFWTFIFRNIKYLDTKPLVFNFILLCISHLVLCGVLFNIRHRTDLIPVLIVTFLMLFQNINLKFVDKVRLRAYLNRELFLSFGFSIFMFAVFNFIYYFRSFS